MSSTLDILYYALCVVIVAGTIIIITIMAIQTNRRIEKDVSQDKKSNH